MITAQESAKAKDKLQDEVVESFIGLKRKWAAVYGATGIGKTNISLKLIDYLFKRNVDRPIHPTILIVVPRKNLKDKTWPEEFEKWGLFDYWKNVEKVCYQSLHKIVAKEYDFVILDEGHNITERNSRFFIYQNRKRLSFDKNAI